jgi:peptidoglycan/LPS O-acetylase OafA/YrhL
VLMLRLVASLGLVSYGIYLWHQLVVESVVDHTGWESFRIPFSALLPVVLLITAGVAVLSFRLVERPGIALGHRLTRRARPATQPRASDATKMTVPGNRLPRSGLH